jgi:hypothetical protein
VLRIPHSPVIPVFLLQRGKVVSNTIPLRSNPGKDTSLHQAGKLAKAFPEPSRPHQVLEQEAPKDKSETAEWTREYRNNQCSLPHMDDRGRSPLDLPSSSELGAELRGLLVKIPLQTCPFLVGAAFPHALCIPLEGCCY